MIKKRHIDHAQPSTVDEHFKLLLEDRSTIDTEFTKVTVDDLPDWFDERLFKIGQEYYMNNLLSFATIHLIGLIGILAVPDILEVLVFTKGNSTVCLSYRRFGETLLLMHALLTSNVLEPDSKWYRSMNTIRWRHAVASKKRVKQDLHGIYHKDMAITQFGFIGFALVRPEQTGLSHGTEEQRTGLNHFWRVTGHLLGISDRLNICREKVEETTELCRRIVREILAKHMDDPDPEFLKLTSNVMQGLWYVDATVNEDAFLSFTYKMAGLKYKKPLGWYSTFRLKRTEYLLYLCSVPYIGIAIRTFFNYLTIATYWVLEYYPIRARIAFGKTNAQLNLYSHT